MKPRFVRGLTFFSLLLILSLGGFYFWLYAKINTGEFKAFAEAKTGELLKAEVQIDSVRLHSLTKIALVGLRVKSQPSATELSGYEIKADRILFRYRVRELLARKLNAPSGVIFKDPEFTIDNGEFPYPILQSFAANDKLGPSTSFELNGGSIKFRAPAFDSDIYLKDIRGAFRADEIGKILMKFTAQADGLFRGPISIEGYSLPLEKQHNIRLNLQGVSTGEKFPVALSNIKGEVAWINEKIDFQDVQGDFQGWSSMMNGRFVYAPNLTGQFAWTVNTDQGRLGIRLNLDLLKEEMDGHIAFGHETKFDVSGKIRRVDRAFLFPEVTMNQTCQGSGYLDWGNGDAKIDLEKGKQRFSLMTNLKKFNIALQLKTEHFKFWGLDVVTAMTVKLLPETLPAQNKVWKLRGQFKTEYFIIGSIPFDDFAGTFEVTPFGVQNFKSKWGEVFDATGSADFRLKPIALNAEVKVHRFDMSQVKEFMAKPLKKKLEGILQGKMKIRGDWKRPECVGVFNVKDGALGKFDYDRAVFQFRGFPPYFPVDDSKIYRGRTTLNIVGALNLELAHPFRGLRVETADKIIIWNGLEVNSSEKDQNIEIDTPIQGLPSFLLKAQSGKSDQELEERSQSDRGDDEQFVGIGAHVKF